MDYFELEKAKTFQSISFRNQRRNLKQLPQTGQTSKSEDSKRKALLPGKRISKAGNTYWETRANRSDVKGRSI